MAEDWARAPAAKAMRAVVYFILAIGSRDTMKCICKVEGKVELVWVLNIRASECNAVEEGNLCKERVYRRVLVHPKTWGTVPALLLTVAKGRWSGGRINTDKDLFVTAPFR